MDAPNVRFAKSGETNIAYATVGDGPFDLVFVNGWVLSALEHAWEGPAADFFRELASFSRLILFDKRGTGLSDRVPNERLPTLEERMDDVRAVLDAAGSERTALFGHSEGGNMCLLFAATYPERTRALITLAIFAKRIRSDDYPWAPTADDREESARDVEARWGRLSREDAEYYAPSRAADEQAIHVLHLPLASHPACGPAALRRKRSQ